MTCDCRKEIEGKLLDRFKSLAPDALSHDVRLKGYTLELTDTGCNTVGYMEFEMTADRPLKKGGFKQKRETFSLIFTFCPFCGVKYKQEGEA